MFLINISEITLENFIGDQNIPRYFILSHTWSDDEVTYQDVRDTPKERLGHRKGWQKIKGFCEMLLTPGKWPNSQLDLRGIDYAWVDTCCINKDSSAELSEAINSMYQWYKNAAACIVYLDDVVESVMDCGQVRSSRWFTRGWTLQELLAPTVVTFYNKEWTRIGTLREDATCISEITGIDWKFLYFKYLNIPDEIESASVAQKMSWAAKRQTTRSEDMAYCLMGLFDVNMPLLYGEGGEKAFCRLQEEILKDSCDESIWAWDATLQNFAGMLATRPAQFHDCANIVPWGSRKNPEAVRNGGIVMHVPCVQTRPNTWRIGLDCIVEGLQENHQVMIEVFMVPDCCRTSAAHTTGEPMGETTRLFFEKKRKPEALVSRFFREQREPALVSQSTFDEKREGSRGSLLFWKNGREHHGLGRQQTNTTKGADHNRKRRTTLSAWLRELRRSL